MHQLVIKNFDNNKMHVTNVKKKTEIICHKLNRYRITGLDRSLRLKVVEARRISIQLTHEGRTVVSPTHKPPLLLGYIPGTHFC